MGQNGRKLAIDEFDRKNLAEELMEKMNALG